MTALDTEVVMVVQGRVCVTTIILVSTVVAAIVTTIARVMVCVKIVIVNAHLDSLAPIVVKRFAVVFAAYMACVLAIHVFVLLVGRGRGVTCAPASVVVMAMASVQFMERVSAFTFGVAPIAINASVP